MDSLADLLAELGKHSQDIIDSSNKVLDDKVSVLFGDYYDSFAPKLSIPSKNEWIDAFTQAKKDIKEVASKGWEELGAAVVNTITTHYSSLTAGYNNWKSDIYGYLGVDSLDEIHDRYSNVFKKTSENTFVINTNEIEQAINNYAPVIIPAPELPEVDTNSALDIQGINDNSIPLRSRVIGNFLNSNVGNLIKSGPDLQTNMFDMYLVLNKADGESTSDFIVFCPTPVNTADGETSPDTNAVMKSLVEDVYMLSVRTGSIDVPTRAINSVSIPWLNTKVDIPQSDWEFSNSATFTVDLDANLYIYDIFNALSGFVRPGIYGSGRKVSFLTGQDNLYKTLATARMGNEKSTMDLVVPIHKLSNFTDGITGFNEQGADILFTFKDVKFLGMGDAIKFSSTTVGLQQVSVPFIFKDLTTSYRTTYKDSPNKADRVVTRFETNLQRYINENILSQKSILGV